MYKYTVVSVQTNEVICSIDGEPPTNGTIIEFEGKEYTVFETRLTVERNPMSVTGLCTVNKVVVRVLPWSDL